MLFNSNEFLVFFAGFSAAYFIACRNVRLRNIVIIVASYIFYASWDYRFTGLLLGTSLLDFGLARAIEKADRQERRRALLATSVILNLGVLFLFKYFNFFRESLDSLLGSLGVNPGHWTKWEIVLPVGISFYTFQSMGYVIDVYRRILPASRDFIQYQSFVSFFPQLVAGPIERGKHMLGQFVRPTRVSEGDLGLGIWLIIWGMFKKVAIADNLSPMVALAYQHSTPSFFVVTLGTIAFALQVYCDFSGYSDIARGLARLLGFELMVNFNLPYFATSLRDFWQRWHISLSTWLRDYLYFPLGGSRRGEGRTYLNLGLTMLLCGLWHGASLTFLLWGLWHGVGLMINRGWKKIGAKPLPSPISWLMTMLFVLYGWMLFRASSLDQILEMNRSLLDFSTPGWCRPFISNLIVLTIPLAAVEVPQFLSGNENPLLKWRWARAAVQAVLVLIVVAFWQAEAPPFIYFQF